MAQYLIVTDEFTCEAEEDSINDAIKFAFSSMEIADVTNLRSLKKKFAGSFGWCYIEKDGERVVSVGNM